MKKFKKTIAIILVLAMIFGISSFPALADCDIRDHTYRAIIMSITFSVKNNSVADC